MRRVLVLGLTTALGLLTSCAGTQGSRVVYITATPEGVVVSPGNMTPERPITQGTTAAPESDLGVALAALLPEAPASDSLQDHTVVSGETLFAIAQLHNTTVDRLVEINALDDPNLIHVGQVLQVPSGGPLVTPDLILLSDTEFLRGPGRNFDVEAFVRAQPGYLNRVIDQVTHRKADGSSEIRFLTGPQAVERVSLETSVDPRVLLAVLEYRAGWLSIAEPAEKLFPLISEEASVGIDREGIYRQLSWVANELNRGYYNWKYGGWTALEFPEGPRVRFSSNLNAATVGLHHMLHLERTPGDWLHDITAEGWLAAYTRLFGAPRADTTTVAVSSPPALALPFARGEMWFFTGGPHGGWGTGSAWSALDFAPPDDRPTNTLCFTSQYAARALADGIIVRSADGVVVLDLDGDGDERTGWTILYLHLDTSTTVDQGAQVRQGEAVGRPSCEGGFSTATHLHIARRYDGEWIPADCARCSGGAVLNFTMSGWAAYGLVGQEYQGSLRNGTETRVAEQGRNNPINQVVHE